jgi:tetratricopeptide (TPR) repeat protein
MGATLREYSSESFGPRVLRLTAVLSLTMLWWALSAGCSSIHAQSDMDPALPGSSYEIAGQITTADGRNKAEFVEVRLERSGGSLVDQRTTDSQGKFRFSRLSAGQYVVSAKAPGFTVAPQTIDLSRFLPRVYLLLQLTSQAPPFAPIKSEHPRVVNANIPEKASKERDKASAALADKKLEQAVLHLQKAVDLFPEFFDAYMQLGSTLVELNHLEKAEAAFTKALKIDATSVMASVSLGDVYRRQKKFDQAEKTILDALKREEASWVGHFAMARVYWETNDVVKSGREIGRAIQLKPDFADAHLLAGNIFVRLGLPENAVIEYEEYLRLAPPGPLAVQTHELTQKLKKSLLHEKPLQKN